jgi:hypothetical protein
VRLLPTVAAAAIAVAAMLPVTAPPQSPCDYVNVDGQCKERPDTNPSGGTYTCSDGSISHSSHRQGACSHHGGVA